MVHIRLVIRRYGMIELQITNFAYKQFGTCLQKAKMLCYYQPFLQREGKEKEAILRR